MPIPMKKAMTLAVFAKSPLPNKLKANIAKQIGIIAYERMVFIIFIIL